MHDLHLNVLTGTETRGSTLCPNAKQGGLVRAMRDDDLEDIVDRLDDGDIARLIEARKNEPRIVVGFNDL